MCAVRRLTLSSHGIGWSNNWIESFHHTLKHVILKSKKFRRVDELVQAFGASVAPFYFAAKEAGVAHGREVPRIPLPTAAHVLTLVTCCCESLP